MSPLLQLSYAVVAAPAGDGVGRVPHLLQGLGPQVAQLPQAAVVEDARADPAGVQVVGRPHLTHITHLVVGWLGGEREGERERERGGERDRERPRERERE